MVKVDSAASDSRDSIAAFFSTFKNPMFMAIVTEVIFRANWALRSRHANLPSSDCALKFLPVSLRQAYFALQTPFRGVGVCLFVGGMKQERRKRGLLNHARRRTDASSILVKQVPTSDQKRGGNDAEKPLAANRCRLI
jgi:hypothetical protein